MTGLVARRLVLAALRSPPGRLSRGLCELRFVGRVSGRDIALPVQCAREGPRLVVCAGRSAGERWWRNFRDGHDVRVRVAGVVHRGRGRVVAAGAPDRAWAEGVYARHHRGVAATDPMVVVDLLAADDGSSAAFPRLTRRGPVGR